MGDAGLDEREVVGKLQGAGNEERIEGRSKEVCKVQTFYVKDWEGGVNQPRQPPQKCHESWLRLMKANYPAGTYYPYIR